MGRHWVSEIFGSKQLEAGRYLCEILSCHYNMLTDFHRYLFLIGGISSCLIAGIIDDTGHDWTASAL